MKEVVGHCGTKKDVLELVRSQKWRAGLKKYFFAVLNMNAAIKAWLDVELYIPIGLKTLRGGTIKRMIWNGKEKAYQNYKETNRVMRSMSLVQIYLDRKRLRVR